MRTCTVDGCSSPFVAKGWCDKHYRRWKAHGDVSDEALIHGRGLAFFEKAKKMETADCIPWPFAAIGRVGAKYGTLRNAKGETTLCHRRMCEEIYGPPPTDEHHAAHGCGNSICINKRHLRWATPTENQADKKLHGTQPFGERCLTSRFTAEQVLEMRSLKGKEPYRVIAERFGTTIPTVSSIMLKVNWAWL